MSAEDGSALFYFGILIPKMVELKTEDFIELLSKEFKK